MEKIVMKREWLEDIPIMRWKGIPLIRIGKGDFITAEPIGKNMRTLEIAKRMAKQFSEKYQCEATVTNNTEWENLANYLKVSLLTDCFIRINQLDECEALLIDNNFLEGNHHLLSGGKNHKIDEIFSGFISDYDANGKVQPAKLAFFTIKFNPDLIKIVS